MKNYFINLNYILLGLKLFENVFNMVLEAQGILKWFQMG